MHVHRGLEIVSASLEGLSCVHSELFNVSEVGHGVFMYAGANKPLAFVSLLPLSTQLSYNPLSRLTSIILMRLIRLP